MKKLEIKWNLIGENKCAGIATIFDYYEDSCTGRFNTLQFKITVEQGCTTASPAHPNKYLPRISEEEEGIIRTMADSFFSGVRKLYDIYK